MQTIPYLISLTVESNNNFIFIKWNLNTFLLISETTPSCNSHNCQSIYKYRYELLIHPIDIIITSYTNYSQFKKEKKNGHWISKILYLAYCIIILTSAQTCATRWIGTNQNSKEKNAYWTRVFITIFQNSKSTLRAK